MAAATSAPRRARPERSGSRNHRAAAAAIVPPRMDHRSLPSGASAGSEGYGSRDRTQKPSAQAEPVEAEGLRLNHIGWTSGAAPRRIGQDQPDHKPSDGRRSEDDRPGDRVGRERHPLGHGAEPRELNRINGEAERRRGDAVKEPHGKCGGPSQELLLIEENDQVGSDQVAKKIQQLSGGLHHGRRIVLNGA